MKHPKQTLLRTLPAVLALVLAAATAQAQTVQADTRTDAGASASASAQATVTAAPQDSSDANVPPATARKQAAEVASGDPQRWYQEDATPAQRLRTMQKEIGSRTAGVAGQLPPPADRRTRGLPEAGARYLSERNGRSPHQRNGRTCALSRAGNGSMSSAGPMRAL